MQITPGRSESTNRSDAQQALCDGLETNVAYGLNKIETEPVADLPLNSVLCDIRDGYDVIDIQHSQGSEDSSDGYLTPVQIASTTVNEITDGPEADV